MRNKTDAKPKRKKRATSSGFVAQAYQIAGIDIAKGKDISVVNGRRLRRHQLRRLGHRVRMLIAGNPKGENK